MTAITPYTLGDYPRNVALQEAIPVLTEISYLVRRMAEPICGKTAVRSCSDIPMISITAIHEGSELRLSLTKLFSYVSALFQYYI